MTRDAIFNAAWVTISSFVDKESRKQGLSVDLQAEIYRRLATECENRAKGLLASATE